jgi:hypothetical protein
MSKTPPKLFVKVVQVVYDEDLRNISWTKKKLAALIAKWPLKAFECCVFFNKANTRQRWLTVIPSPSAKSELVPMLIMPPAPNKGDNQHEFYGNTVEIAMDLATTKTLREELKREVLRADERARTLHYRRELALKILKGGKKK